MKLPIFSKLESSNTVLLAGMGGGFDVFCALPLYFWLRANGKTVHLANLSFTDLTICDSERRGPSVVEVTPSSSGSRDYFPEAHLAKWLSDRIGPASIYAIHRTGAAPVAEAYRWLAGQLRPDALVLVDGGTDSLLRGDETGLGTPQEDAASLAAAFELPATLQKFLVCLGFGVDAFHGVCHARVLENIAALIADDAYLGCWSLLKQSEEFKLYEEACAYVHARMPGRSSIVNGSVISAANGNFGNFHSTKRTEGSELFINPLMPLCWAFQLEPVARRNLYLDQIRLTQTYDELTHAIETFSATRPKSRPWLEIPC